MRVPPGPLLLRAAAPALLLVPPPTPAAFPPPTPAASFSRITCARMDMKRADGPLDEEIIGLQVLGGTLGLLVGGRLLGSSVLGVAGGALAGRACAYEPGLRGARARELGWQLSQRGLQVRERAISQWRDMQSEAAKRDLTTRLEALKKTLRTLSAQIVSELRALDEKAGISTRLRKVAAGVLSWVRSLLDSCGVSAFAARQYRAVCTFLFGTQGLPDEDMLARWRANRKAGGA